MSLISRTSFPLLDVVLPAMVTLSLYSQPDWLCLLAFFRLRSAVLFMSFSAVGWTCDLFSIRLLSTSSVLSDLTISIPSHFAVTFLEVSECHPSRTGETRHNIIERE
jgi:hypothetical protein